jgi:hypothetical protein
LYFEVIIPTVKLFQKNIIYLSIRANIVETLLLDKKEPKSTYKAIYTYWTVPGIIRKEVREDQYIYITLEQPGIAVCFCFIQVLLAVFRQFPNLSNDTLLTEIDSKKQK